MANDLLSVAGSVHAKNKSIVTSVALFQPTPRNDRSYDRERTKRKRAAVLCHEGRYEFKPSSLVVVPEWPLVYWWSADFLAKYASSPKLKDRTKVLAGLTTGDNPRFCRRIWEVPKTAIWLIEGKPEGWDAYESTRWVVYIKGPVGEEWLILPRIYCFGGNLAWKNL